jgi:chromatin structure-remodeling complex subunit RSC9
LSQIANHIKVHLPPPPSSKGSLDYNGPPPAKKLRLSYIKSPPKQAFKYYLTAVDERNDAAGIPLSSVLVLRNLARNLSKTEAEETALKEGGISWVDKLFKPVQPRLFEVMAHNKSLVSLDHHSPLIAYADNYFRQCTWLICSPRLRMLREEL